MAEPGAPDTEILHDFTVADFLKPKEQMLKGLPENSIDPEIVLARRSLNEQISSIKDGAYSVILNRPGGGKLEGDYKLSPEVIVKRHLEEAMKVSLSELSISYNKMTEKLFEHRKKTFGDKKYDGMEPEELGRAIEITGFINLRNKLEEEMDTFAPKNENKNG